MSSRAKVLAPAKVNLFLRVLGRRPDGYHEIDTLFQAIGLYDEIEVKLGGNGIELEVVGADLGPPKENLAYRAAETMLAHASTGAGVRIRLTKRIPVGAGLGGGSSDAAAVLRCLGQLFGERDAVALGGIAAELGSDVPFFLGRSPLAHGTGRGEVLQPVEPLAPTDLVVLSPPVHVSTGPAYAALTELRGGEPRESGVPWTPPTSWSQVVERCANDFEPVIAAAHPEVRTALEALRVSGASCVLMSGSGSSCFGVYGHRPEAHAAVEALHEELGWPCWAVRTLKALPPVSTEGV
jgi:4-diphosphocytidyl-2-C-methyl-D-erythritol kinase